MSTTIDMLPPDAGASRLLPRALTGSQGFAQFISDAGLAARTHFEQGVYSLTHLNVHFQDVSKELERLRSFLRTNGVAVQSAVDVGCGDGAITLRLKDVLGLLEISGVELNSHLAATARARGITVIEADMECLKAPVDYDLVMSYGSLHHAADIARCVRGLATLSRRYLLIVDNTVRNTALHKVTGSAWFPLELSPYRIHTCEELLGAVPGGLRIVGVETFRHANVWHDRSFILTEIGSRG